jgi:alkanesulfonate monooxygenase SsuD/methylene tetrahydromethanopterin reductase-like flavin-dependent oxidoreductase (luciferase family)
MPLEALRALRPGSIFTILNLHQELDARAAVAEVRRQARMAIELGFDGVAIPEHHAGFPRYVPNPLQMVGLMLAELPHGWAGPLPLLLPLRSLPTLVEDLAWLHASFPGRVVAGCAVGYYRDDFDLFGVSLEHRYSVFRTQFRQLASALAGEAESELLRRDPAVAEAAGQIPLVVSSFGQKAVRMAAEVGAGLSPPMFEERVVRELFAEYRAVGGTGPRVVESWVFLGDRPVAEIESAKARSRAAPGDQGWKDINMRLEPICERDPERLIGSLVRCFEASDGTALGVRFHIGGLTAETVRGQMERFGGEVLPILRQRLAATASVMTAG